MAQRLRVHTSFAILLTATAGFVDAVGYLTLGGVYTANMSGNSVGAGIDLARGRLPFGAMRLWTILCFFVGLLGCRVLMEALATRRKPVRVWIPLSLELLLLISFMAAEIAADLPQPLLIVLVACAMGVQNATITHFGRYRIYTGFVTGTLTKLAVRLGSWLVWATQRLRRFTWRRLRRVAAVSVRRRPLIDAAWLGSFWTMYVVGAFVAACGLPRWNAMELVLPCTALSVVLIADLSGSADA